MADVLSPSRPLGDGMKVFRRMTLRERGHFSNHPTLWPVAEVCIGDDSIILKQGFVFGRPREYRCSWSEISEAVIHVRKRWKAYGKAGGWITQRLLVLKGNSQTFAFDVSGQFPDFRESTALVEELRRHVNIQERDERR